MHDTECGRGVCGILKSLGACPLRKANDVTRNPTQGPASGGGEELSKLLFNFLALKSCAMPSTLRSGLNSELLNPTDVTAEYDKLVEYCIIICLNRRRSNFLLHST